jgi:hypothetical protein
MPISERRPFKAINNVTDAFFLHLRAVSHAGVVTIHAVNTKTRAGKNEFFNAIVAGTTFEATLMVQMITCRDGILNDSLMADVAIK